MSYRHYMMIDSRKIIKNKFTESEDAKLAALVEKHSDQDWAKIASEMGNRNTRQCRERWKNYIAPSVRKDKWTKDEDEMLMSQYRKIGPHWSQIRTLYMGRSVNDIRNRWLKLMRQEKTLNSPNSSSDANAMDKAQSSPPAAKSPVSYERGATISASYPRSKTKSKKSSLHHQQTKKQHIQLKQQQPSLQSTQQSPQQKSEENTKIKDVIEMDKKEKTPFDFLTQDSTFNLFTNADDGLAIFQILNFFN